MSWQSPALTKIMILATNIGDKYTVTFLSLLLLISLLYKKDYLKAKIFAITIGLATILSQLIKIIIQRARPETMLIPETGFSFPSGHATLAFAFFGILIYLFKDEIKNKILKYSFIKANIFLIFLIGFSRIYLNVHWFTDILGGFALGLICIFLSIYLCKKIPFLKGEHYSKKG